MPTRVRSSLLCNNRAAAPVDSNHCWYLQVTDSKQMRHLSARQLTLLDVHMLPPTMLSILRGGEHVRPYRDSDVSTNRVMRGLTKLFLQEATFIAGKRTTGGKVPRPLVLDRELWLRVIANATWHTLHKRAIKDCGLNTAITVWELVTMLGWLAYRRGLLQFRESRFSCLLRRPAQLTIERFLCLNDFGGDVLCPSLREMLVTHQFVQHLLNFYSDRHLARDSSTRGRCLQLTASDMSRARKSLKTSATKTFGGSQSGRDAIRAAHYWLCQYGFVTSNGITNDDDLYPEWDCLLSLYELGICDEDAMVRLWNGRTLYVPSFEQPPNHMFKEPELKVLAKDTENYTQCGKRHYFNTQHLSSESERREVRRDPHTDEVELEPRRIIQNPLIYAGHHRLRKEGVIGSPAIRFKNTFGFTVCGDHYKCPAFAKDREHKYVVAGSGGRSPPYANYWKDAICTEVAKQVVDNALALAKLLFGYHLEPHEIAGMDCPGALRSFIAGLPAGSHSFAVDCVPNLPVCDIGRSYPDIVANLHSVSRIELLQYAFSRHSDKIRLVIDHASVPCGTFSYMGAENDANRTIDGIMEGARGTYARLDTQLAKRQLLVEQPSMSRCMHYHRHGNILTMDTGATYGMQDLEESEESGTEANGSEVELSDDELDEMPIQARISRVHQTSSSVRAAQAAPLDDVSLDSE